MRLPTVRSLGLVFAGLVLAAPVHAGTIGVPSQQPTIQAGIDAAVAGDTVLVAPGHYVEHLDFHGKAITVQSSDGAAVTIVDGGGSGSVVSFTSGESASSVLRGFTITGGAGSAPPPGLLAGPGPVGGGIKAIGSGPVLQDLVITANSASDGGGVFANAQVSQKQVQLTGCTIRANSGGGVGFEKAGLRLDACEVSENVGGGAGGLGGLITLNNCTIHDNVGFGVGFNTIYLSAGGKLSLDHCTLSHNAGGGVGTNLPNDGAFTLDSVTVKNTRFEGNTGTFGAAVYANAAFGTSATFDHCVFTANGAPDLATVRPSASVAFRNCTFADNLGPVAAPTDHVQLSNCIVLNNPGTVATALVATWSDVQGGAAGTGNIDADPLFRDEAGGDYHLKGGSPCIDTGNPASPKDADGTITDMGGLAFAPFTDAGFALAGAAGTPVLSGTGTLIPGQLATFKLTGAAHNAPFVLIVGVSTLFQPFKGGTVVPAPDVLLTGLTDSGGNVVLAGSWPAGIPHGFITWLQFWITDAGGPKGYAASNGLAAEAR